MRWRRNLEEAVVAAAELVEEVELEEWEVKHFLLCGLLCERRFPPWVQAWVDPRPCELPSLRWLRRLQRWV